MWIFFALASQLSNALENTVDKIAVVGYKQIDSLCATFLRVGMYVLIFGLIGATGILGHMRIFLPWPIIALGVFWAGGSLCYTYFLKHLEITAASVLSYAAPFIYLLIDSFVVKANLSLFQISGIILMTLGGLMFVVDPHKLKVKKEITFWVWAMLLFNFIMGAAENYGFKYYFTHYRVNEVTYGFSVWFVTLIALFLAILFFGKIKTLFLTVMSRPKFIGALTISKTFDSAQWWLYLHALSLASASQVSATSEFFPLILLLVVFAAQSLFKFKAEERFSRGHLSFKLAAVVLLFVGGFLIR